MRYVLLDGARLGHTIEKCRSETILHCSLFDEKGTEHLINVGPWLFETGSQDTMLPWLINENQIASFGILLYTAGEFKEIFKHLKKKLRIVSASGQVCYHRFYDPRVLNRFLISCQLEVLNDFFGPVNYFVCESGETDSFFSYSLESGKLLVTKMKKEEVLAFNPDLQRKRSGFFKFWG
jgi:hypothetical protein